MFLIQWLQRNRKAFTPTYLYFNQTFSDFAPRVSSALERFVQLYFLIDSPQLLDAIGKQLKFQINVRRDLKKSFYWVAITLIFRSPNTRFVTWMWLSYLKEIRNLEDEAVPFNNIGRYTNCSGLFVWIKCLLCWEENTFSFPVGKK